MALFEPLNERDRHHSPPPQKKRNNRAENFLYLFFSPSETSQAAGRAFWERRHTRANQDVPSSMAAMRAQAAAIARWGVVPKTDRYGQLKKIKQPVLVVNRGVGERDLGRRGVALRRKAERRVIGAPADAASPIDEGIEHQSEDLGCKLEADPLGAGRGFAG